LDIGSLTTVLDDSTINVVAILQRHCGTDCLSTVDRHGFRQWLGDVTRDGPYIVFKRGI
jgi:hypothetical protein